MNLENNNLNSRSPSTKIPSLVSPLRRARSVRVRGDKANLSSSVPLQLPIQENVDYSNNSSWGKNLTPLSFIKNKNEASSRNYTDEDLESIGSVASNFSIATNNSTCEHASFAKNGTTYSGKTHKYIVHCSSGWNEQEEYLTPTQRANKNIKKLKSLLQLAREKLREKEEEIFRLSREVIELKSFKESIQTCNSSPESPLQSSVKSLVQSPVKVKNPILFNNDNYSTCNNARFSELSPIKNIPGENLNFAPASPSLSQDGLGDKSSLTPDFLLSSMADSGNFDDLPSSASIHSKDSVNFVISPEFSRVSGEHSNILENENDDKDIINLKKVYEKKLEDKKLEYELELSRVMNEQEERNIKIIHEFENKLKEEELKFEARWNELLKATEEEKILIVNRFEEKLEEEQQKFKEMLNNYKAQDSKVTDMVFDLSYSKKVEEEKTIYETSLMDIKEKFEKEKLLIEKKFDNAMTVERTKFEETLNNIREINNSEITELKNKVSKLELEYSNLLPKYEDNLCENEKLQKENETLKETLKQTEESHKKIYLALYQKGQAAAKLEAEEQEEEESCSSKKVSVPELFAQLKITEVELENLKAMYKRLAEVQAKAVKKDRSGNDPEATLQFLKSAVYYFLTDRENHLGHLKAIESILAFTSTEKSNIEKLYLNRY